MSLNSSNEYTSFSKVIKKPIQDAFCLLDAINNQQFSMSISGPFSSSIGEHMRHIIDHYNALIAGADYETINYNLRSRKSSSEVDIDVSRKCWEQVDKWLEKLDANILEKPVEVLTEHGWVQSTVARELSFISSHADHHFAIIKLLAHLIDVGLPPHLGVAPATIKFDSVNCIG